MPRGGSPGSDSRWWAFRIWSGFATTSRRSTSAVAGGHCAGTPAWQNLKSQYEEALGQFEAGNYPQAVGILGNLVTQNIDDGPTRVLLARVVEALGNESHRDTVWELPGK